MAGGMVINNSSCHFWFVEIIEIKNIRINQVNEVCPLTQKILLLSARF
jgi:hypothetical protein